MFSLRSLFKRQASTPRSGYAENISALQSQLTPIDFLEAENYLPTVVACVDLIVNSMASLPVRVVRKEATSKTVIDDHPILRALRNPPRHLSGWGDVMRVTIRSLLAYGNAVIVIDNDDDQRVTLEPVPWPYCSITSLSASQLEYQITRPYRSGSMRYPQSQVIHIRTHSDDGGVYGRSVLERGGASVALVKLIEQATNSHWKNGCYPSLALSTTKTLNPDSKRKARDELIKEFAGDALGRPLLLDQDIKATALPVNAQHMQHLEQREFGVTSICRLYGIPPVLVSDLRFGTYSNFAEALKHYHELTLQPYVVLIEQALTHRLLADEADVRVELDTSHLRVSRTEKVHNLATLVKAGIIDATEAKRELGYA